MAINFQAIEWFRDSPQEGDPDCKCSWCRQVFGPSELFEDEYESAIRLWRGSGRDTQEARFHDHCFRDVLARGILQLKTGDSQ